MEMSYENGTLSIVRTFDAPQAEVFSAWVETSKVQRWWGCAQTRKVESDIEPRVGGKYNHLMTIEGAGTFPMNSCFTAFEPSSRLAYEEQGESPNPQRVRVDFLDQGESTEVRLVHENIPDEFSPFVKKGWTAAFEKLDSSLQTGSLN